MEDKTLIEDDIIDLTDLLEEGKAPSKAQKATPRRKMVNEPDSFDLGKEISMEYDVSVEEIEHDADSHAMDKSSSMVEDTRVQTKVKDEVPDLSKESSLGNIEAEIDMAIQGKDKYEEVSLTSNEQDMLLKEEPTEESQRLTEKKPTPIEPEPRPSEAEGPEAPKVFRSTEVSIASPVNAGIPTEVITEALISEIKKDMPALLEGIIRPMVKELLQEITSATRDAIPSIVEKVIREEIEKLKKL